MYALLFFFFFQAEDGIRDVAVTGVQTCALPICPAAAPVAAAASSGGPGRPGGADEFGAFLADVTVTVGKAVEAWRARRTEGLLRWEGVGRRTQPAAAVRQHGAPARGAGPDAGLR